MLIFGKTKEERQKQKEEKQIKQAQEREALRQRIINNENIIALVSHYKMIFSSNSNELRYLRMKGDYVYSIKVERFGVINELTHWIGTKPEKLIKDGLLFSDVGMNDLPSDGVYVLTSHLEEKINAIGTVEAYTTGNSVIIRANKSAMQDW